MSQAVACSTKRCTRQWVGCRRWADRRQEHSKPGLLRRPRRARDLPDQSRVRRRDGIWQRLNVRSEAMSSHGITSEAYVDLSFDVCPFFGAAESLHELLEVGRVGRRELEPGQ